MRFLTAAISGLLFALIPQNAWAFELGNEWRGPICNIIPCSGNGGGAAGLSGYVTERIVTFMEVGFIAAILLVLFFAAMNMVIYGHDESAVKDGRMAFVYCIAGAAVTSLARWFVMAFSPSETGQRLVNQAIVDQSITNLLIMFRLVLATALLGNIVAQAMRLISSQGDDDQRGKAQKRLIASFVGAGFVMLANALIVAVNPTMGSSSDIADQIVGIANYLVTILGFASVVAIIAAGILLIVSVDEKLKDKAKSLIKTSVVALIAVLTAYALVTAFISL